MSRHVQQPQPQSNKDLILPRAVQFLEFPSRVEKTDQSESKDRSSLIQVNKSRLVGVESEYFIAYGANERQAIALAENAEYWLDKLATEWFNDKDMIWPREKVEIIANVDEKLPTSGATTFEYDRRSGKLLGWKTTMEGPGERLTDSVIPHEVSHMLATVYFTNPLIRWADEGIASSLESSARKKILEDMILSDTRRQNSSLETFEKLLVRESYPENEKKLFEFYAKSMSLTEFLVEIGGKERFIAFLEEANPDQTNLQHWNKLLLKHYGINGSTDLEKQWRKWVRDKMND